jgi:glycosyltransferase involved in cell wall biosynthesis
VRLLGWREDVDACLRAASIHCCPSRPAIREAFGLVVLEAKHAGIPSVVFQSGALPELVSDRVDGWVCEEDTADALADGLQYFLMSPDACAAAGRQARESTKRFDGMDLRAHWWHLITQPARLPVHGLGSWRSRMSQPGKLT